MTFRGGGGGLAGHQEGHLEETLGQADPCPTYQVNRWSHFRVNNWEGGPIQGQ